MWATNLRSISIEPAFMLRASVGKKSQRYFNKICLDKVVKLASKSQVHLKWNLVLCSMVTLGNNSQRHFNKICLYVQWSVWATNVRGTWNKNLVLCSVVTLGKKYQRHFNKICLYVQWFQRHLRLNLLLCSVVSVGNKSQKHFNRTCLYAQGQCGQEISKVF